MKEFESSCDEYHTEIVSCDVLWTVEDVALFLRLKPDTVRIMSRTKKLPAIKVGRCWRFRKAEIEKLLDRMRTTN